MELIKRQIKPVKRKILHGDHLIADILNPDPLEIDSDVIRQRLNAIQRYSQNPKALSVYQHCLLVESLAVMDFGSSEDILSRNVRYWALHHDDHEAIVGDLAYPVKSILRTESHLFDEICDSLDRAICFANGMMYPTPYQMGVVKEYDRKADTFEWEFVLGMDKSHSRAELNHEEIVCMFERMSDWVPKKPTAITLDEYLIGR